MKFHMSNYPGAQNNLARRTGLLCVCVQRYNDFDFHWACNGARHFPDTFSQVGDVFENPDSFFLRVLRNRIPLRVVKEQRTKYEVWEALVTERLNQRVNPGR